MNCNSCRFELSQCLDGRLPSGRRAVVMHHVDECAGCATYWDELQAAQELVLRLPSQGVGHDFRDRLWARIQAGEGTPEAVFREPIAVMTKVRYALTGAAAAAAVLLAALWLHDDRNPRHDDSTLVADANDRTLQDHTLHPRDDQRGRIGGQRPTDNGTVYSPNSLALVSSAQPLTADLVAKEAARQFVQRYSDANFALTRLHDEPDNSGMLRQAFESADELRGFGNLLLTLRDRDRLSFSDVDVDADLRVAVNMLDEKRLQKRNLETARYIVAPALSSKNLANVLNTIRVQPSVDPRDEVDVLWRLNTMQPEAFSQLFFVIGNPDDIAESFGVPRRNDIFLLQGQCGPQWVAPRSQVGKIEIHIVRNR
ncbi:MAG: hypothetical protein H6838_03545 [Planctomycetes bacterium]|nr:hypothetical protein [Planctomycetota bacterium]MCB9884538.1 hypothetical protein [Planctomycetota bacterium]